MKLSSSFFTTPFLFSDNLQRQKIDLDIVIICGMIVIEQIFESVGTMGKYEKVELTNMCMVYDNDGNILVQDRVQKDWSGITFPGGHIEANESFVQSVIREVKEETGLDIKNPIICGFKQFELKKGFDTLLCFTKQMSSAEH